MLDLVFPLLELPPPPALPVLAIERPYNDVLGVTPLMRAEWMVKGFREATDSWAARVAEGRHRLAERAKSMSMEQGQLDLIAGSIAILEEAAESQAISANNTQKMLAKRVKRDAARDPALGAVGKFLARGLMEQYDRAVEVMLEQCLFLRALHAEYDPDARGGKAFDDADKLAEYLRSALS